MKKIMFNDKYRLTQAVLDGRKTQTRRVITVPDGYEVQVINTPYGDKVNVLINRSKGVDGKIAGVPVYGYIKHLKPAYKVGEVVAVAQKYSELEYGVDWVRRLINKEHAGWNNKMFVSADEMPQHIRFTNTRVERLQDISDEDCLAEGIHEALEAPDDNKVYGFVGGNNFNLNTPREAYATLIDKISGRGTWESNPWVFVYDFEKVD